MSTSMQQAQQQRLLEQQAQQQRLLAQQAHQQRLHNARHAQRLGRPSGLKRRRHRELKRAEQELDPECLGCTCCGTLPEVENDMTKLIELNQRRALRIDRLIKENTRLKGENTRLKGERDDAITGQHTGILASNGIG